MKPITIFLLTFFLLVGAGCSSSSNSNETIAQTESSSEKTSESTTENTQPSTTLAQTEITTEKESESTSESTQPSTTAVQTEAPKIEDSEELPPDENSSETPVSELNSSTIELNESSQSSTIATSISYKNVKGRGKSDIGRDEPNYIGLNGYIVINHNQMYDLEKSEEFLNTPWFVPVYEKLDDTSYQESGTVEHKTNITVLEQYLKHEGWDNYSGYLLVSEINTDTKYYINVSNFLVNAYWLNYNLIDAVQEGYFIAEYHQTSTIQPVDLNNDPVELEEGSKVLVTGRTGTYGNGGPQTSTNPVEALVFKNWKYGYGASRLFFNAQDLSIIY